MPVRFLLLLLFLPSCAEGSSSAAPGPSPPPPAEGLWVPAPGVTWQWQLDVPVDVTVDAEVFDIDLFENDAAVVADLHGRGKRVVCYLSAGSWESWRPDAGAFPAVVLGQDYEGWPGERWLDIRRIDLLAPILRARLDQCRDKGFDAVEPDNIDGYTNATGFPLTASDQLAFNRWLASEAHGRGLSIALKNDGDQVPDLLSDFDWALVEDCFADGFCAQFDPFVAAGRAVLAAEYTDRWTGTPFCSEASARGFSAILKNRELDAFRAACAGVSWTPNDVVGIQGLRTHVSWSRVDGALAMWQIDAAGSIGSAGLFGPYPDWLPRALGADPTGRSRVLWSSSSGGAALWVVAPRLVVETATAYGPYAGWSAADLSAAPDGSYVLWRHTDGRAALWSVRGDGQVGAVGSWGPWAGWRALAIESADDGQAGLLWTHEDGQAVVWWLGSATQVDRFDAYGPFSGWQAVDLGRSSSRTSRAGSSGSVALLWRESGGAVAVWRIAAEGGVSSARAFGPYAGYVARRLSMDEGGDVRVLWTGADGQGVLWSLTGDLSIASVRAWGPY